MTVERIATLAAGHDVRVMAALLRLAGHRDPAARLAELGHRGGHRATDCPLVTHIGAVTGIAITVTGRAWRLAGDDRYWTLPDPLRAFVIAHDEGLHPNLEPLPVEVPV